MVFLCRCFDIYLLEEEDEQRTQTKSTSVETFYSTYTDFDARRSGPEVNSHNPSYVSTESGLRAIFPILSQVQSNLRVFTLAELKTATRNFSPSAKIGEGGFGCVYKGVIKSTKDPLQELNVAVKQSKRGLLEHRQWVTEVNVLGVVQHQNLVKLLGYCAEDDENGSQRLLVYEYMCNRSVEDHLSRESDTPLPWAIRLKVARDAARGLVYLHEGINVDGQHDQIIFRDFKPSNILLDDQWNAKLSDFGLVRFGPPEGRTHVSTMVRGTREYAAPEYVQTGHLTFKNDVWSYGVFLKELITGLGPVNQNRPKSEPKRLEWVKCCYSDSRKFPLIVDWRLRGKYSKKSAQKLVIIANRCMATDPKSRPTMTEVLEMLNQVKGVPLEATNSQPTLTT